jgi:hypothetical protein
LFQEKTEGELDRRVITEDFKRGFKSLNELLAARFKELDEQKESI